MKKLVKRVVVCAVLTGVVWTWGLLKDRAQLGKELIRLHVVANSDSAEDQAVKLQVRDAILDSIRADLQNVSDVETAKAYLQESLPKLQAVANRTLAAAGVDQEAIVSLCKEAFDIRNYDTFALPSGIYESLRVTIGEGEGQNWWCVSFPSLCIPATSTGFESEAVDAGLSPKLTKTLTGEYQVRFFFLDALGQLENKWHAVSEQMQKKF